VLNALSICEGTITRERRTRKGTEKGILDFFLVCDKILPLVTRMVIDEKGENALCKYRAGNVVKADHHMLKIEINIMFHMKKDHERNEMFNLKDKVCQQQFKLFTTNTKRFTRCFETEEIFDIQFKRWQRQLQKALYANFRKIRIKNDDDKKKLSKIDTLINQKRNILKKRHLSAEDYKALDELEAKISGECEEKEWEKLREVLKGLDTSERNTQIWKQMKRAYPNKTKPVPTGVMNIEGKVITNPKEKGKVILDHFTHRMRKHPVMDEIREISDLIEQLFQKRLKLAKNVRSQPFTIEELRSKRGKVEIQIC
jgi:hypothetical protein